MTSGDGRTELREQYRLSVEEYRFQVNLNWRRSEYFFVLNIGVLIAGTTLLASERAPRALVGLVFLMGALLAFLSFLANDTQSGYYREARERKKKLEEDLELGETALKTTPGMGSRIARLGRVGSFLKTMLVAILVVDLVGCGISFVHAAEGRAAAEQVLIRVGGRAGSNPRSVYVVATPAGHAVDTRVGSRAASRPFELEPGRYQVWFAGPTFCSKSITVSSTPLQVIDLTCP